MPSKDFSFLQDPTAYHVLPTTNIPGPFLNAPNLPPLSTPIDSLLQTGHYRLAAIAVARNIVQSTSPSDYTTLLHLLHIRLACLCLLSEHALAAHECKVLGDLNSTFYRHPLTNAHLVPWDLRLLVIRLAALGYGEWRKGIMGYYELAQECRDNISKPTSTTPSEIDSEKALWRSRLRECGIRVANILTEMGDLEGAGRHLSSLSSSKSPETDEEKQILYMETLVWLRLGDIASASRCLSSLGPDDSDSSDIQTQTLEALRTLTSVSPSAALPHFRDLHSLHPTNSMISQNLAVCLLYSGRIAEARFVLSELAETTSPFHSLVFNLCTIHELCTERSRERKMELAERLATRGSDGVGWEVQSGELKL